MFKLICIQCNTYVRVFPSPRHTFVTTKQSNGAKSGAYSGRCRHQLSVIMPSMIIASKLP